MNEEIIKKWEILIKAAKNYYVDFIPTGFTDAEYDELERKAIEEDNFSVRDYIFETYFPKGERYKNSYIEKFKKSKVTGSMFEAISGYGSDYYYDLKYDGTSMAIYLDSETGIPKRAVTCGNSSLGYGIDQTWKIIGLGLLPKQFPKGIEAIQCECLIDLDRIGDIEPDRARQAVNGIINGKKDDVIEKAKNLLTLRAYRYYCSDSSIGIAVGNMDYKDVIDSFPIQRALDGHITFAPADIFTFEDLSKNSEYCETDHTRTSTGYFLNDGYIVYNKKGEVIIGLKYSGAGSSTEGIITSTVKSIQWNNQNSKGKDSWSANIILDTPVNLHGSEIRKPSAGSVGKLINKKITPGAVVSVILANSTIPMIGECYKEGDGDFMWPVCSCGYALSASDVYGSNLKCGNKLCTERLSRMRKYISSLSNISDIDLNKFLIIDRFKWEKSGIDIATLLLFVERDDSNSYCEYLKSFLTTDLQKKNLELVWEASYTVLREVYLASVNKE